MTLKSMWMRSVYLLILLPCWWSCDLWWIWPSGVPPHRWRTGTPHSSHKTPPLGCCHCRSCRTEEGEQKRITFRDLINLVSCYIIIVSRSKNKVTVLPPHGALRSNLSWSFHCAAGSFDWVHHKNIFHHIHLHTFLSAHRTADHIHYDKT